MDDFSDLTDDQIQNLISLGVIPAEMDQLQQQMKQAQSLRDAPAPQGATVRDGIYVAASPLEHIARAAQGIKAQHDLQKLYDQQQGKFDEQTQGRMSYFDALRGRTRVGRGPHSFTVGQPTMQDIELDPSLLR